MIQINGVVCGRGGERPEDDDKIPFEWKLKDKKPELSRSRKVSAYPQRDISLNKM